MTDREYNKGKKWARDYFSKFSSFKKDSQGRIVGNKKGGSTEVIGTLEHFKGRDSNSRGTYEEIKRIVKSKQVRSRKAGLKSQIKNRSSGMSMDDLMRI